MSSFLLKSTVLALAQKSAEKTPLDVSSLGLAVDRLIGDFDIRTFERLFKPSSTAGAFGTRSPSRQRDQIIEDYRLSLAGAEPSSPRVAVDPSGLPRLLFDERQPLTGPSSASPESIARDFLSARSSLFRPTAIGTLELSSVDSDGRGTIVSFAQRIEGLEVFQSRVRVTLNRDGEVIAAGVENLVPMAVLRGAMRWSPQQAMEAALRGVGVESEEGPRPLPGVLAGESAFPNPLGSTYNPIRVQAFGFPMGGDQVRPAYRIYFEGREAAHEIVMDADDGKLLFRRRLTSNFGQARVWTSNPLDGDRELVDFPEGWLPEMGTVTTGNNADVYLDTDGDDEADPEDGDDLDQGRTSSESGVFDFPAGEGTTGEDPRDFRPAALANAFYFANRAHDFFYDLGFTEEAGNFQTDNFEMGGVGEDAVRVEIHDPLLLNNAAFRSAPDGSPPRMQMGLFTRGTFDTTDDRDTAYDLQINVHEYAHGVTTRLVGGPDEIGCLSGTQAGALGEGWSDYYAGSVSDDPVAGTYPTGNSVSGVRRHSYEDYPFTYEDLGNSGFRDIDDAEIWAAALWDLRAAIGSETTDQLVTDALKTTPCDPHMIEARDEILAADQAAEGEDRAAIWEAFAAHGMGASAAGKNGDPLNGTVYTAAFDLPEDLAEGNLPPLITSVPPLTPGLDDDYVYQIEAKDPEGGVLEFELTEGPEGMTVDPATGLLQWTTSFTEQRVKVTVSDGQGGAAVHGFHVPVVTLMMPDQPLTIAAPENSVGLAVIDVPADQPVLQVRLRGGTGDADLFVGGLDGTLSVSFRFGNDETVSIASPAPGFWTVLVGAFEEYSGVTLEAGFPVPEPIEPTAIVEGLSGDASSGSFFQVSVPEGATAFTVRMLGGSGDADLFVRHEEPAVCSGLFALSNGLCEFDDLSGSFTSDEFVQFLDPEPGEWFIDVRGFTDYQGVTLETITTMEGETAPLPPPFGLPLISGVEESLDLDPVTEPEFVDPLMRIGVPPGATRLVVELRTMTPLADLDLFVRFGEEPVVEGEEVTADYSSETPEVGDETIVITGVGDPPLQAGWYSIGVWQATPLVAIEASVTATIETGPGGPEITPGGIVLGTGTPVVEAISPNSIFTIFGQEFAPPGTFVIRPEVDDEGRVSTTLAGSCVEINGERSPLFAVLPTQINGQASDRLEPGQGSVVVIRNCGTTEEQRSPASPVVIAAETPAFFNFVNTLEGRNPIATLHGGGPDFVGEPGLIPGVTFTPARPNEFISLFGTGFGETSPALEAGDIPSQALPPELNGQARLVEAVNVSIGGIEVPPGDVFYAGDAPCCAGLYQLVVPVPGDAPAGDLAVTVEVNGVSTPEGPFVTVRRDP